MNRLKLLCSCATTFLLLVALTAPSASATLPERVKTGKGGHGGGGHGESVGGKEGVHIGGYECKNKSGCESEKEKERIVHVICERALSSTTVTGSKTTRGRFTFLGCYAHEPSGGRVSCQNRPVGGEILSEELIGTLGYVNKATKTVGESFTPENPEGVFLRFTCGNTTVVVGAATKCPYPWNMGPCPAPFYPLPGGGDSVIATVEPVNTPTFTFFYNFLCRTVEEKGKRWEEDVPDRFERMPLDVLEDASYETSKPSSRTAWESACWEFTLLMSFEEEWEIKA